MYYIKLCILVLFLLSFLAVNSSASNKTCYSIELWSIPYQYKKVYKVKNKSCSVLHIGEYSSLRCGCFQKIKTAKKALKVFHKQYKRAYIKTTLKSRFDKNDASIFKKQNVKVQKNEINLFENKYDFNVSNINLTPMLQGKDLLTKNKLVNAIKKFSSNNQMQMQSIQNDSNFFGLSFDANYDQYVNQNYLNRAYTDYEYNLRIKYDIFKNGYYAHKIEKKKKRIQQKTIYYENLIKLQQYNHSNNIKELQSIVSKINVLYYDALIKMYDDAMKRKKKLIQYGIAINYELDLLLHEKDKYKALKSIYETTKFGPVNKNIYALLHIIDSVKLVDIKKIKTITKNKNANISVEREKSNLSKISRNFYDTTTLNLYASQRNVDKLGWYQTVGVEFSLPLNFSNSEDEELNRLKMRASDISQKAITHYMNQSLERLYKQFSQLQKLILVDKHDIKNRQRELHTFKQIGKYEIPNLKVNVEEKVLLAEKNIIDANYDIEKNRIALLKVILNISFVSNIYDINKLIVEKQQCQY